jgi:hypothetical protein
MAEKLSICRDESGKPVLQVLFAMQKVEGSNPFSRSRRGPVFAGLFCVRSRLVRLRPVGLTPDSPRADRRPFQRKPLFAGHSGSSEPKFFCGVCRRSGVRLLRPLPRLLLQRHDPADSARRRDTSGGGTSAPVRFQSGNREVNLGPLRGNPRRAMAPRAVSFSGDGVRRSFEVPIRRTSCRGSHAGVVAEGVAFHRQPDVLRAPGLGC